jgi:hypothetical protein
MRRRSRAWLRLGCVRCRDLPHSAGAILNYSIVGGGSDNIRRYVRDPIFCPIDSFMFGKGDPVSCAWPRVSAVGRWRGAIETAERGGLIRRTVPGSVLKIDGNPAAPRRARRDAAPSRRLFASVAAQPIPRARVTVAPAERLRPSASPGTRRTCSIPPPSPGPVREPDAKANAHKTRTNGLEKHQMPSDDRR